ncbi:hypothetical protein Mal65_01860 [Crateriforma conspicua]|nr:hypothetical protein Mal65_01860 [Crateriforma conspicua]
MVIQDSYIALQSDNGSDMRAAASDLVIAKTVTTAAPYHRMVTRPHGSGIECGPHQAIDRRLGDHRDVSDVLLGEVV